MVNGHLLNLLKVLVTTTFSINLPIGKMNERIGRIISSLWGGDASGYGFEWRGNTILASMPDMKSGLYKI